MARVARKRVVLLTWLPDARPFWLTEDYFPEIATVDRQIFPGSPALTVIPDRIIGSMQIAPVPIPHDCTNGFSARIGIFVCEPRNRQYANQAMISPRHRNSRLTMSKRGDSAVHDSASKSFLLLFSKKEGLAHAFAPSTRHNPAVTAPFQISARR